MTVYLAAALALFTALGHSYLSERLFLSPLRAQTGAEGAFADRRAKRLVAAMFHLPSVCWAGIAASMLLLDTSVVGAHATLRIYAAIYALSGLGNFWAVGKPHPGGILLLSAAVLTLVSAQVPS